MNVVVGTAGGDEPYSRSSIREGREGFASRLDLLNKKSGAWAILRALSRSSIRANCRQKGIQGKWELERGTSARGRFSVRKKREADHPGKGGTSFDENAWG